jgi:hypothetical protein
VAKLPKSNLLYFGIMLFVVFQLCSCSTIQTALYLLLIDDNNGEIILQNEKNVREFLEQVVETHENYTIRTFVRTAINSQIKRTKLITHSYYVLIANEDNYYTLSFYGTKMTFYSEGAWALNADSDFNSYRMFMEGNNKWDVTEIFVGRNIDVRQTILNVIGAIDSDVTYYYRDHIKKKKNMHNCNTALYETIVFSDTEESEPPP